MSLAIDVDRVSHVLIGNEWFAVKDNSLNMDSFEFIWWGARPRIDPETGGNNDPLLMHGGGNSGVCPTGFEFKMLDGTWMAGPLTAIQAVKYAREVTP